MQMAFELAANKAHVCFIGTPHETLSFTPDLWEKMKPQGIQTDGFLDVLQLTVPRKRMGSDGTLLRHRAAEV